MASEEPLFDPSLKKKKKTKKTVAFSEDPLGLDADPTTPAPPPEDEAEPQPTVHEQMVQHQQEAAAEEDPAAMFGDLKKKKKKKDIPMDLGEEGTATPPSGDLDFSDLKKKKKKAKKTLDMEDFEKQLKAETAGDDEDDVPTGDHLDVDDTELGDDPFAAHSSSVVPAGIDSGAEPWLGSDRDYTYQELLNRFFSALHASNPALLSSAGKRYTIAPPSIHRDGNKKTVFANIADICKRMHRQPEHVIQFLFAEMGTTGSVDGAGRLVIRGRFLQKQVENVLRRYIVEYVTCKTCKSPDTILTKENRIYFMSCESCGSRRSVSAIKSGFQAQVGRRSRNKTG
ncbi:hypothetical protein AURDEDRAFT_115452 [Auricularia subglabra TFB-10046 SS5]|nr:hypothetical protein AURDEDRAFT_115452 [Auricularia subglabra TFB-10046 SS5]